MKVAILGASGIIGQHMRLCVPEGITPIWVRNKKHPDFVSLELTDWKQTEKFLNEEKPHVIVNLAGESNPDVVQFCPGTSYFINVTLVKRLRDWCLENGSYLVQVSTQAVFSGQEPYGPPYNTRSPQGKPVNEYGIQKQEAEEILRDTYFSFADWVIARPTFVLGVRKDLSCRENPVEQILSGKQKYQVADRHFSISFARDVAEKLWQLSQLKAQGETVNIGLPYRLTRHDLANLLGIPCTPVPHSFFKDAAPRPLDTTYYGERTTDVWWRLCYGLEKCKTEYLIRMLNGK